MLFSKDKDDKPKEPQYYQSATNMQTLNYRVYYMKPLEKLIYALIAFAVGAAAGYLFYGGIGKDEFGRATSLTYALNIIIPCVVGIIAAKLFIPIRTQQIIEKRRRNLKLQFRDMLDSLNTSLSSGKNVPESFAAVYEDLKSQYEDGAYIIDELEVILTGIRYNVPIEDMLADFGERSDIEDIKSFGEVFQVSYRKGGNIKDIIRNTHIILSDKMEMKEEMEAVVSSSKMEQKVMIVMPFLIVGMIKMSSPDFASNFTSSSGILATTVAIVLFVIAYFIGKKILDIKI